MDNFILEYYNLYIAKTLFLSIIGKIKMFSTSGIIPLQPKPSDSCEAGLPYL